MAGRVAGSPLRTSSLALDRASTRHAYVVVRLRRRARVLGVVAPPDARVAGLLVSVNRARN